MSRRKEIIKIRAETFPAGASGKEPTCQSRRRMRHQFDPWVRKIPWRKAWQPTPILLTGESHGQRNLAGCSSWGHKESDWSDLACTGPTRVLVRQKPEEHQHSRDSMKKRSQQGEFRSCATQTDISHPSPSSPGHRHHPQGSL